MRTIKHFVFTLFIFVSISSVAQPTITSAVIPTFGDTYISYFMEPSSLYFGDSGANVIWDFSSLVFGTDSLVSNVISPVGTPYAAAIPLSDFVVHSDSGDAYYSTGGNTRISCEGFWGGDTSHSQLYNLGSDLIHFPASYLNTFHDTGAAVIDLGSGPISVGISIEYKADGYGTLITPFDTIANCLRIKGVFYAHILTATIRAYPVYWWYNNNFHFPVFSIDSSGNGSQSRSSAVNVRLNRINNGPASVKTVTPSDFKFYETVTDHLQVMVPSTVTVGSFIISDLQGQIVFTKNINSAAIIDVSTAELAAGIYFLQVRDKNGVVFNTAKWMKR